MGRKLDLKNPKTFSEKLQWLKLYDRKPIYTTMVDKYAVKQYVAEKIGKEYVIPTLGVWNTVEEIEWDKLPNQFVLKVTHDSGGVVICKDKSSFDFDSAKSILQKALKHDYYYSHREWPYKDVPHRIIAESYMQSKPDVNDLPDYKWYCFNGEPKFCQVIQNRHSSETIDFFDIEWQHQEFVGLNPVAQKAVEIPQRPKDLESQIKIAKTLSKGIAYCRIDLYEINDLEYFGEITFYPMSGMGVFKPDQYNEILGAMLKLPGVNWGG